MSAKISLDEAVEVMGDFFCDAINPQLREAWAVIKDALPVWRPIESAPLDTPILTLMKHGAIQGCMRDKDECTGYYWQDLTWYPSYWMPLPGEPK